MTSMAPTAFSLVPFPDPEWDDGIAITGDIRVTEFGFAVDYRVHDADGVLAWPVKETHTKRCDNLWAETCFEVFVASPGTDGYCEYNFSPSGHWNCYHFITYRTQQTPVEIATPRIRRLSDKNHSINFRVEAELIQPYQTKHSLVFGINAVAQRTDGHTNYYALTHCDIKPDFHLQQGFTLAIAKATAA